MIKRRVLRGFDRLLLTNKVSWDSPHFQSLLTHIEAGSHVPAIVVARTSEEFLSRFVVIDGNARAVAHAFLKRPLRYFELRSNEDVEQIKMIEARGGLSEFPHRAFLTGDIRFESLRHEAVVKAAREMNGRTARDLAVIFRAEMREASSARYGSISVVDQKSSGSPESQPPVFRATGLIPTPSPKPQTIADAIITQWSSRVRSHFANRRDGREFACAYNELARICGEGSGRGTEIAECLQQHGVLRFRKEVTIYLGRGHSPSSETTLFWSLPPERSKHEGMDWI